jgi:hypothetical protein
MIVELWMRKRHMGDEDNNDMHNMSGDEQSEVQHA